MNWTERERQIVLQLKEINEDMLSREIAEKLNELGYPMRTPDAIRGILRRYKQKDLSFEQYDEYDNDNDIDNDDIDDDEYQAAIKEISKLRTRAIAHTTKWSQKIGNPVNDANVKVVSLSDTHIPFYHDGVINEVVEKHNDADVLVLNGDFLELFSVSKWPKNKQIMLRHEYEIGMKMLRTLAKIFPKIYLVRGNHEERLQSYFSSNIDPSISFLVSPDLLHRMSEGYDFDEYGELVKMHKLDNVFYNKGPLSWYIKVGKCIFAHPSGGSGIPMRTIVNTANYFLSRGEDFEAVCVGHTHQMGKIIWNKKILIEQGCACVPLEYEATSKMSYRPQSFGYAVIYMDKDGHVDFDKSNPVYYGTGAIVEPKSVFELNT